MNSSQSYNNTVRRVSYYVIVIQCEGFISRESRFIYMHVLLLLPVLLLPSSVSVLNCIKPDPNYIYFLITTIYGYVTQSLYHSEIVTTRPRGKPGRLCRYADYRSTTTGFIGVWFISKKGEGTLC